MCIVLPARARTGRRSACRGGAALEFALILPLFLAILFGIIDYGWYFYQRYALVAAIRDGVRYGATFSDSSAWNNAESQAITDLKATGSPINYLDVTWGPATPYSWLASPSVEMVTLSGSMAFKPLIGFVPAPALVKYQLTMLLEIQP
ncbi:MAG TPA: TadE/TadG family type IV pilus assembly protein [Polyangia bacterium]|nr:TadE/TadG family type IV pilus assembly protein [Polyangia bacterium]